MSEERAANAIDKRLGERVRARRLQIGMSQEKLAALLGVTFQQVQKYEKGVNRIAASRLFDVAAALDLTVASFYEGLSHRKSKDAADDAVSAVLATPDGAELVRLFSEIKSVNVRRRVVELVRAMTMER